MTDATIRTLEGSIKSIPQDTIVALRGKLRGSVVSPGEDGCDAARSIWNAMVDRAASCVAASFRRERTATTPPAVSGTPWSTGGPV